MTAPKFFYGGWTSEHGEVSPVRVSRRTRHSHSNCRYVTDFEIQLQGELTFPTEGLETDPGAVAAKIALIDAAFTYDYGDWGFIVYDENGDPIRVHECLSNDALNLSGNQIDYFSWNDACGPTELANTRSWSAVLRSTWASAYSEVVDGYCTFSFYGTGEEEYELIKLFNGNYVKKQVSNSSWQTIHQKGYIVWMSQYPPNPTPPVALASVENKMKRIITKHTPVFWGDYSDPKYALYRIDYEFWYDLPPDMALYPQVFL